MAKLEFRNIAIIAHVDHGKTTLVDKMLRQAGAFRENQVVVERVMDSNPLERERGITILAKNTSHQMEGTRSTSSTPPGHADYGGEVERILRWWMACCSSSTRSMGRCRDPLRAAQGAGAPRTPIVVITRSIGRGSDPMRVHDEVLDLLIELEANEASSTHRRICSGA